MNGGRQSLSAKKLAQKAKLVCHRKKGDIHKANNQVWRDLEGRLLERIRTNRISADYKGTGALTSHLNN